jgi:bifunctional UDP-N-acetylglucosamine pyrophosphorylase/glucosamine-1-phosphate N-acetyltransferase
MSAVEVSAHMSTKAIVLAAGKGTRMKSDLAKVLHRAAGRSLLDWCLTMLDPLALDGVVVVVGHQADEVEAGLPDGVTATVQEPQLGTADAARVGLEALGALEEGEDGTVLVLPGDMPLLESSTFERLLAAHRDAGAAATVLTALVADPTGYGRVVRSDGDVVAIVEHRDADDEQLSINEVNTSVYAFDVGRLRDALSRVRADNSQAEYYLTDVIGLLAADGERVTAVVVADAVEASGVNSHAQLAAVGAVLRTRINEYWLDEGVWMLDPGRVYLDVSVKLGAGARLYPDVYLEGATTVGAGAEVGPSVHARDTAIAAGAKVRYAVLDSATVGVAATVGPFSYLRPGADLGERAKAGAYVEIKNSTVGAGSKVPHLSYIGDATIGEDSNLGAGTVTVNYDGFTKHRTTIGDRVRIGSDTMLIAPVTVGDDAYTGAGSVISKDVAPGALALERSPQKEVPGYAQRRKNRAQEGET